MHCPADRSVRAPSWSSCPSTYQHLPTYCWDMGGVYGSGRSAVTAARRLRVGPVAQHGPTACEMQVTVVEMKKVHE